MLLGSFLLTYSIGCRQVAKSKFSEEELKWLNAYNAGDTLIFRSDTGEFDTSFIVDKKIYYPEFIPIEVHDKYLPHTGFVTYKNAAVKNVSKGEKLIYMVKNFPNKDSRLFIDYLNSGIIISDLTKKDFEKYKNGKIFTFNTYHPKAGPDEPKEII